jgi:hypothetical protein
MVREVNSDCRYRFPNCQTRYTGRFLQICYLPRRATALLTRQGVAKLVSKLSKSATEGSNPVHSAPQFRFEAFSRPQSHRKLDRRAKSAAVLVRCVAAVREPLPGALLVYRRIDAFGVRRGFGRIYLCRADSVYFVIWKRWR